MNNRRHSLTPNSPIDPELLLSDFDYHLPTDLIAQEPPADRDGGRMLIVDRTTGTLTDSMIRELPKMLRKHDLVVVNNTRVIPGRLRGKRETGGAVEVLLLNRDPDEPGLWTALARPAKKLPIGTEISFEARDGLSTARGVVTGKSGEGQILIQLPLEMDSSLDRYGEVPLPPYIRTRLGDECRYQTVFSSVPGSAAAPTAGLHLTNAILERLESIGVARAEITLQIGLDTFRPVTAEKIADHAIHTEWCSLSTEAASAIELARSNGGRVIAIGTTCARTLESWGRLDPDQQTTGYQSWTDIFITPGYEWTTVDALLTNFHLPKSTLLMMVSSFMGRDLTMQAYWHAVKEGYRFFSFGDAMLIV